MKVVHSWLKEYLGDKLPEAEKVEELLTFHSFEIEGIEEKEGEQVIDVDVLPNRSSDCLSHRGIARELAAVLDVSLVKDPLLEEPEFTESDDISITIEDPSLCPRFTASLITNIEVKDSPDWLKKRLRALGVRSINNVVDATNYVMYALGEPLHAYDADLFPKTDGKWNFVVRLAKAGERVSLLGEGEKAEERIIECIGTEVLIVDGSSDTPIGLAGVKGGKFAGVHKDTKNIIIEAAHFDPTVTRKTARRLSIVIDASKRFENEPSRELPPYAQRDVIELITSIAGGKFAGYKDEYLEKKANPTVKVTLSKTNALLGLNLSLQEISRLIKRTGAKVSDHSNYVEAIAPFERTDLLIEEDYIEEVGRLYGLNNIESVSPLITPSKDVNKSHFYADKIRNELIEAGFSEIITSTFQKKDKLQLQNALAKDKSFLRSTLTKNIEEALLKNTHHTDLLGLKDIKVFEIGTVFTLSEAQVKEYISLAIGSRSKNTGYCSKDDKLIEMGKEAVARALGQNVKWQEGKGVAETNLSEILETLPTPLKYDDFVRRNDNFAFKPISIYPAIARDIAVWVPDTASSEEVKNYISASAGELLVRQTLFDEFKKDNRTSYAFRLVFQSNDRTLTDKEVNEFMESIYSEMEKKGFEVR